MKVRDTSLAVAAAVAGGIGIAAYGIAGRSSQIFGASSYHGSAKRRTIALTFDDGPSPGSLPLIDYLASQGIRATFFQCGMNVRRHPEVARRIHAAGHEIGNHTYSHARLCPRFSRRPNLLSPLAVYGEFALAQEVIMAEIGTVPSLLRAPYGLRWFGVGAAQRRLHLHGVMWTVIGQDWRWPGERVAPYVLDRATPGGIICLHDGRDIQADPDINACLTAVRRIVPALLDAGYQFETVTNILRDTDAST